MKTLQEHQAAVEAAEREAREANTWYTWLTQNHNVAPCLANYQAAKSYHNGTEMTVDSLNDSFNSPAFRSMLALQTTEEETAKLVAEYRSLLTGSPTAIESEFGKAKYLSADQVREKVEELKRRKEIQKLPTSEIRRLANQRPIYEEAELPAKFTRAALLAMSGSELRKIIDLYGREMTTKRLNERTGE
jgi:hypothetical protein